MLSILTANGARKKTNRSIDPDLGFCIDYYDNNLVTKNNSLLYLEGIISSVLIYLIPTMFPN